MERRWSNGTMGRGHFRADPLTRYWRTIPAKTPYFFESEGMSPLRDSLSPGEEYSYPDLLVADARACDPIAERSHVGRCGQRAPQREDSTERTSRLTGTFGVFSPGTIRKRNFSARWVRNWAA